MGEFGTMGRSWYYQKVKEGIAIVSQHSHLAQVDIIVMLLMDHGLRRERIGLAISKEAAKSHLSKKISGLSTYQLKCRVQQILQFVETTKESE